MSRRKHLPLTKADVLAQYRAMTRQKTETEEFANRILMAVEHPLTDLMFIRARREMTTRQPQPPITYTMGEWHG